MTTKKEINKHNKITIKIMNKITIKIKNKMRGIF